MRAGLAAMAIAAVAAVALSGGDAWAQTSPTPITFTAATASLDSITVTLSQDAKYAGTTTALDAANWIVDPDGVETPNDAADDITVTAAAFAAPRTITLTLDAADAQIGTTAKAPYVGYTGSGEIDEAGGAALAATSATATDGAPPAPTGAVTGPREITLTFHEMPTNAPNDERLDYTIYAGSDRSMNLTQQTPPLSSEDLVYTAATGELVIPANGDLDAGASDAAYVVRISVNAGNPSLTDGANALSLPHEVPVPVPPTYTAHVASRTTTVLTFNGALTDASGAAVTTSTDIDESEWAVFSDTVLDTTAAPSPTLPLGVSGMAVTDAGAATQVTITHAALSQANHPPWVIVKHTRGASPSLGAVSEDFVFSTTALPTFTAEVLDGSQVVLTFDTDITGVPGSTATARSYAHPQELNPTLVAYHRRNIPQNAGIQTVYATALSESLASRQVTLTFGGEASAGLLTSTPLVSYTQPAVETATDVIDGTPPYQNSVGSMHNRTFAFATDNASPVAFAEFADADTIRVRFSEEMADPASALSDVTVAASGSDVAIMGTPSFTAHTTATASSPFVRPELTIDLASDAAADTVYTVSFPGFAAAGGPAGKRAVADATAVHGTAALGFTAATSAQDTITVTLDQSARLAGSTGELDAANWIVDPSGMDSGSNAAADDITVTAAAFSSRHRTITLTLDAADEQIGTPAKTPYVEYTGSGEIETHAGTGLAAGASAVAADGAPPEPTGAITGTREITLTFGEAPAAAPNHASFIYDTYEGTERITAVGAITNRTAGGNANDLMYTAATAMAPAELLINTDVDLEADHTVRIRANSMGGSRTISDGTNVLELPHFVTATLPPLEYTAETRRGSTDEHYVRIEFSRPVTGTTVAGDWYLGVNEDGTGGTAATTLYRYCTEGGSGLASPSIDVAEVCGGSAAPIAIRYVPNNSADTTRVAYRASGASGTTAIMAGTVSLPTTGVDATDGLPPLFTAATSMADTVVLTFDEPVTAVGDGAPDASRWLHYDSTAVPPSANELAAAVTAGTAFGTATLSADGLTLTLALSSPHGGASPSGWDSANPGSTPDTIGYDVPAGMPADLADAQGNGVAHNTALRGIGDRAPPAPVGYMSDAREITLEFPEAPTADATREGITYSVATAADAAAALTQDAASPPAWAAATSSDPATVTITMAQDLADAEHTVTITSTDGARIADGDGNALPLTHAVSVTAAPTFEATTVRILGSVFIRIEFTAPVTGTTVNGEWFIGVNAADGTGGTAANGLSRICATSPLQSSSLNVAMVCTGDAQGREIYLHYDDTVASDVTPHVAYRAPSGSGATPIVSATGSVPLSRAAVAAADGLPPRFEAVTATLRTLEVTFDEDVAAAGAGAPDASRWYHYVASMIPPSEAELAAAVTAGTNFASASLAGRTLTLALPDSYRPSSGWGADTAAVPDTIGYSIPDGMMPDIVDASPAANGLAHNTVDDSVTDGAPLEYTARTARASVETHYVVIEFSEAVTGTTVPGEWYTGVAEDGTGGTQAMRLYRYCTEGGSGLASSSIDVTSVCNNAAAPIAVDFTPANSADTTRVAYRAPSGTSATPIVAGTAALPSTGVEATDGIPPLFTAATSEASTVVVTFDEPVVAVGSGAPDASRWHHYDSTAIPPSATELAAAVTAGTEFDTATLSADGLRLTLGLSSPHGGASPSGWDSADPGSTPNTIGYDVPGSMAADLADAQGNGLDGNTALRGIGDGAPPAPVGAITGLREITLTFPEAPTASPAHNKFIYDTFAGSDRAMNLTASATASSLEYTAATATAPAALVIPTRANLAEAEHTVRIRHSGLSESRVISDGANELPIPHEVTVPIPATVTFRAAATALDEVVVSPNVALQFAAGTTSLAAASWIVDPDGRDTTTNDAADDITVTSATFSDAENTITLALDATDAQIGDTAKVPYVEYTGSGELETSGGLALSAGASAVARDAAPPAPVGAITGLREITLTFHEAPARAPNHIDFTYATYTRADIGSRSMNLTRGGLASSLEYRAATATAPAELVIPASANLAATEHVVRIENRRSAQLTDGTTGLSFPHHASVPVPTEVTFTAAATALDEVVVSANLALQFASGTTSLDAANWLVDPDSTSDDSDTSDDITVTSATFSATDHTITLALDAADAQIGDTTKVPYVEYTGSGELETSGGLALEAGASAVARDAAPPLVARLATAGTGAPGEDPADPADNVYTDHIDVTLTEPVAIEAGTAAQRAGHWTVTNDDDGDAGTDEVAVEVADAAILRASPSDASSRVVRVTLAGDAPLGGTTATPTVAYNAASASAGRIVAAGQAASAATLLASVPAAQALDGTGPRLLGIPVRGDLTPATPTDDDGSAFVFSFSEDLDPATVRPAEERSGLVVARLQIDSSSPTGKKAIDRTSEGSCRTSSTWSPITFAFAVDSMDVAVLSDIVESGGTKALGTRSNTMRLDISSLGTDGRQGVFWACLNPPGSDYDDWVDRSAIRDTAGNPHIPVEEAPHDQFIDAADTAAPAFTATVTSATEIRVFYDEPVRLADGAMIDASEWRIDTTPNDSTDDTDGATWITPTSVSHSFGPMLRPEYYVFGPPDHLVPTDARLGIVLTVSGGMFDPDRGLDMDGTTDNRPRVHYTSSATATDVVDVYGNAAASPASAQARDTLPPGVESITVGVSTASTDEAPVPSRQHARASATSPVDITFTVRFDEQPDPTQAPILGILTAVNESTTVAATAMARDEARVWEMTETAATDDGHTWEYTWRVANPLPGETTPRPWGTGFALSYGILVQDSDGNDLVYTQASRYPAGSMAQVTLDSAAPEARAVEMRGRPAGSETAFTSVVGRPGSEVELRFTVNERPDRLAHRASGSGATAVYEAGLDASAVTFFSGADVATASSLTCDGASGPAATLLACAADSNGLYTYRATATIPMGHAEGADTVEWAVSALDIFGQVAATDSTDIGTTGHPTSLGFTVDSTAPEMVAASSHAGVDTTGGSRAATDALSTVAGIGTTVLVDITFNEAIGGTPQVEGVGTRLAVADDGTAERVAHVFHPAEAMTAVAGSGNTRWQHSYAVPAADPAMPSTVHHDSEYRVRLLMPMDTAGNTQMNCEGCGLDDVRVDNVAPSVTEMAFVNGIDSMGEPAAWAALEYTEVAGLRADGLRAYLNMTSAAHRLAGDGTLLVQAVTASDRCVAATPTCTTPSGSTENSRQDVYFQFDYGGASSATGLTDIAGNAVTWDQPDQGAHATEGRLPASGFRDAAARFAAADDPLPVMAGPGAAGVNLASLGLGPAGEKLAVGVSYAPPAAGGASIRLAAGTDASGLPAADPGISLAARAESHEQRGTVYYAAIPPADDAGRDAVAKRSLESMGAASVVVVERLATPAMPVLLSEPARVTLPGVPGANAEHVYWISNTHTADAADDRIHSIPECGRDSTAAAVHADDIAARTQSEPSMYVASDNAECFVRDADADAIHVWTNHFTPFGASVEMVASAGGSGCDDCSPPTLGVDSTGARQVVGGFTYNGAVHNVDYYYTPMPLIEVETGVENVAVLKIYEDSGIDRLAHAGLAFGLGRGQHFAEAEAEIRVSIMHGGELSIALDDESGAIDRETLRVDRGVEKCMPGGEADCTVLTIHHTFLEPLEFDVVSTNVWDTRRNAWQNFYNHGIHVDGSSLNPQRGIEVNGGEVVLYPLISARVDEDGDGIYDYDERHVTYMLDEGYGVWRLTPDGTYAPLRNLRALHHEVDDSMYADGRIRTHGAERSSALFAEAVSRQEAIAEAIMAEMGMAVEPNAMPVAEPSPYEGMSVEPRLERLSEEIAREINVAERLVASMMVAPAAEAEAASGQ